MSVQIQLSEYITDMLKRSKGTTQALSTSSTDLKNRAIRAMAASLWRNRTDILEKNEIDMERAHTGGETEARLDRLRLNESRIEQMMDGLEQVARLSDPVATVMQEWTLANGLQVQRVRVPMGVVAMIYESRPNVTVDAAALTLKTGNAVVLRGGKEAMQSNQALVRALRQGLTEVCLPADAIQLVEVEDRATVDYLIRARGHVDLVIPRGGSGLINRVVESSLVPVIETGIGNCHVYVDEDADLEKATRIVVNAKTSRPSVCNAMETLLVHESVANVWLPTVIGCLLDNGVAIRGCEATIAAVGDSGSIASSIESATELDYQTEFLDLTLAIKVVSSVNDAIEHIAEYGTKHSESIVTENKVTAKMFLTSIDAAAVYHNASTRFTDGFEFGFGAEIGISTQKLHARGPMGLEALTTYKYIIEGDGQVRN